MGKTGGLRLIFAPALETPEGDAECQQLLEILLTWQGRDRLSGFGEAGGLPNVLI
ncbi:MAG TPA: hypothetical protein VN695_19090 [Streptosporangiaceae bacterium]|nr:hypothetical protein [Streptosporangiaceae bacterium]